MKWHPEFSQLSDLSPDELADLLSSTAHNGFHAMTEDPAAETALRYYLAAAARCADGGANDE